MSQTYATFRTLGGRKAAIDHFRLIYKVKNPKVEFVEEAPDGREIFRCKIKIRRNENEISNRIKK